MSIKLQYNKLQESGMSLPDSDVQALAWALIDEALDANEDDEYTDEINIDQLRNVLVKHEGLVENLTIRLIFLIALSNPSTIK